MYVCCFPHYISLLWKVAEIVLQSESFLRLSRRSAGPVTLNANFTLNQINDWVMKRILSLFILISCAAAPGFTQSASKTERHGQVWVGNTGPASIAVKCERFEGVQAAGSYNYFCWDACYDTLVNISVGTLPIAPGDTNKFFYGAYEPRTGTGNSTITYCFYVDGTPSDSACLTLTFNENSPLDSVYGIIAINPVVGIEFIGNTGRNEILGIHPNPAKSATALSYSLMQNVNVGQLVVRNMLGSAVYRSDLKGTVGQVIIPVGQFNNGMYFCTMIVDNKVYATKRLVVNH